MHTKDSMSIKITKIKYGLAIINDSITSKLHKDIPPLYYYDYNICTF